MRTVAVAVDLIKKIRNGEILFFVKSYAWKYSAEHSRKYSTFTGRQSDMINIANKPGDFNNKEENIRC